MNRKMSTVNIFTMSRNVRSHNRGTVSGQEAGEGGGEVQQAGRQQRQQKAERGVQ